MCSRHVAKKLCSTGVCRGPPFLFKAPPPDRNAPYSSSSLTISACTRIHLSHPDILNNPNGYFPCINEHSYWHYDNGKRVRRRTLHTCVGPPDDSKHKLETLKTQASDSNECQEVVHNTTQDIEKGLLLLANDAESLVQEKEDCSSGESTDIEKEFYDCIQTEDDTDELLSMLLSLEENFPPTDRRICITCLRLAEVYNDTGDSPQKVLDFARQAFHNFDSSKFPLKHTRARFLMGIAHYKMGELKQAVQVLDEIITSMETLNVPLHKNEKLAALRYTILTVLGQAEMSLGMDREGSTHVEEAIITVERNFTSEDCALASYYQQTAAVYMQCKKPADALGLCLKALPIFRLHLGPNSSEEAGVRSLMLQIYYELNDYERVLTECQLVRPMMESLRKYDEAISIGLESMQAFFHLGKHNVAVAKLNEILSKTNEDNLLHLEALILLARAFNEQGDDVASAKSCKEAAAALEKSKPSFASAKTMVRLSIAYERLHNYEEALSSVLRSLQWFENCTEMEVCSVVADVEGYAGILFLSSRKHDKAIYYLERSFAKKKSIYGSNSEESLYVCNYLGIAYVHAGCNEKALAVFEEARRILGNCGTSNKPISIYIHSNISLTFRMSGRYKEAITWKEHVVDLLKKASSVPASLSVEKAQEELEELVKAMQHGDVVQEDMGQFLEKMMTPSIQAMSF